MDIRPEHVFPLLPFVIIAVVVVFSFANTITRQNRRYKSLRSLADRWQGMVFSGGYIHYPHAELRIGGTIARLQYAHHGKRGAFTELTIHFPDAALRLEIYPQTMFDRVRKLLGRMQDIEVGQPAFDERFIIQGNDQDLIRDYLTLPTQTAIRQLAECPRSFDLHLLISGGCLRLTKRFDLNKEEDLQRLITAFESLFLSLIASRNLGIEILPKTAPNRISQSHCQVCGETLRNNIVLCTSCETPHHLECWQYFGSCNVYACGQKRYRAAKGNVPA